jgi:hypothetical protein
MRTRCPWWLLPGLLLMASSGYGSDEGIRVILRSQSKSWIKASTFDEVDFTAQCDAAGVTLMPAGSIGARATAIVTYRETKGPGFSMFGVGKPAGYGTDISLNLTLTETGTSRTLVSVAALGATPAGLPVERFYDGAVEALHQVPAYHYACDAIAAALGSRAAMLRLLPWAVMDSQGRAIVDRLGFQAQSDLERAYLAVARRDFTAIKALGTAAIEPLTLLFENSGQARNDIGLFPATVPDNAQTLSRALPILASAEDDRVADALTTFVGDYADYSNAKSDPTVAPVLSAAIRALGKVGTVFTLPLLEEWQKGDGDVAGEAKSAVDALRRRLAIE